jgi:amidohydrolase
MTGARTLVDAGLYTTYSCPIPDVVLGQHVFTLRAGAISSRPGTVMAGMDGMVIKVFGRGAHGSMPHLSVDPVLLASQIVVRLQGIVSREIPPGEIAVVTVGAISSGTAENIISDEATLKVNTRSISPQWRQAILDAIQRVVRAECVASNCPKEPTFQVTASAPPIINDLNITARLEKSFTTHFGSQYDPEFPMAPASEDFGLLASSINRPSCFWALGGHDPADYDERRKEGTLAGIPVNHSPFYAPVIQPTLKTGAEALVVAAWAILV